LNIESTIPRVTVVIVNYNRCDDLREALFSIKAQDYPHREIVVVDNASQDGSRRMLAKEFPEVRMLALSENIGMDGYSLGFRQARGEIIFQMDNDSLMPGPQVLQQVVRRFQEGPPHLAAVATRVEEYRRGPEEIEELRQRDPRIGPINTGGFHAGGVGFRSSFLKEVDYYNRDVFLYGSELFLQMKFLAAGYQVFYYPEIFMLHKSSGLARDSLGVYYEVRNRYWFMRHFATPGQKMRFVPAMVLHDAVYTGSKKALKIFCRSLRDGWGPLPPSLTTPLRSGRPDFVNKVNEVGRECGISSLWRRIQKRSPFKSATTSLGSSPDE
jgi:hypothetical protein